MSVRETPRLIARVRLGANGVYALHFKVAEDAVMPVTTIRLRKESKEQKNIAHSYAVVAKMSLGSASLTESTVPAFEHWIMMAESLPPQLPLR